MTIKELQYLLKILNRIKNPDEYIAKAVTFIEKDLDNYKTRKGQLKDQYETHTDWENY